MSPQAKTRTVFRTGDEERAFWASHSPLDYFNVEAARRASFPSLRLKSGPAGTAKRGARPRP